MENEIKNTNNINVVNVICSFFLDIPFPFLC